LQIAQRVDQHRKTVRLGLAAIGVDPFEHGIGRIERRVGGGRALQRRHGGTIACEENQMTDRKRCARTPPTRTATNFLQTNFRQPWSPPAEKADGNALTAKPYGALPEAEPKTKQGAGIFKGRRGAKSRLRCDA
jgi:hypothetical protein